MEQYLLVLHGGICYPGDRSRGRSLLSDVCRERSPQWLTLSSAGRDPNLQLARLQFSRRHEVARTESFRRQVERGARGGSPLDRERRDGKFCPVVGEEGEVDLTRVDERLQLSSGT